VTVLSYAYWQTQYGGRRDVLGEKVRIASVIYTIIGVAPRGFVGLWADQPPAAYVPIASYGGMQNCTGRATTWWETYGCGWASMIVRRKPAVSLERANADLARADAESYEQERIEQSRGTPTTLAKPRAIAASILPDRGPKPSLVSKVAKWTGGVSIIVLLIACANVANLLLARGMRRRREIAVRLALGVSRARLLSQLFTESVLLAALGGAAGLLVANFGGAAVNTGLLGQSEVPAGLGDSRTILFALAAAAIVALLTGLAPVLQARHADLTRDLKAGVREGTYGRSRTRSALLVFQGALSVVLLVGAGLFVRSLRNVQSLRLGYDVDPILLVSRNMRGVAMDSARDAELSDRLLRTAQAIPGVASAAGQTTVPFLSHFSAPLYVEGIDTVSRLGQFYYNAVTPDYFKTMGTRIVRGRAIEATDVAGSPRVMVVSEAMARALWPGRDPVGQRVRVGGDTVPWTTVVGVAENMREERLRSDSMFSYYLPSVQFRQRSGGLFVRVSGRGTDYKEAIRKPLQHEMPGASYVTVTPLADIVAPEM
jgi:predicted permease